MISNLGLAILLLVALTKVNSFDWKDAGSSVRMATNCDFWGDDIGDLETPRDDCVRQCVERPNCTKFTWTDFNISHSDIGTCWLKSGNNSVSIAIPKYIGTTVCGYKAGGGTNGSNQTTVTQSTSSAQVASISTSHQVPTVTTRPIPQDPYEKGWQRPEPAVGGPRATVKNPPSVFDKNPWLLWTLTGIAIVVTVAVCICCRFCCGSAKISETEEGKDDKFAGYRLGRRPISVGPPKPI